MNSPPPQRSAEATITTLPRADARRNMEAVIEAALAELSRDPNASMADIAAAAGLGRTTVYRHFETREELIAALFHRVIAESQEATAAVIVGGKSVQQTLRDLGPVMVEIGERFRFLRAHVEIGAQALADSKQIPHDPVRVFLVEAQAAGMLRADAPLSWMQSIMQSSAMATLDEIAAGAIDAGTAGQLLGETFVAAFAI